MKNSQIGEEKAFSLRGEKMKFTVPNEALKRVLNNVVGGVDPTSTTEAYTRFLFHVSKNNLKVITDNGEFVQESNTSNSDRLEEVKERFLVDDAKDFTNFVNTIYSDDFIFEYFKESTGYDNLKIQCGGFKGDWERKDPDEEKLDLYTFKTPESYKFDFTEGSLSNFGLYLMFLKATLASAKMVEDEIYSRINVKVLKEDEKRAKIIVLSGNKMKQTAVCFEASVNLKEKDVLNSDLNIFIEGNVVKEVVKRKEKIKMEVGKNKNFLISGQNVDLWGTSSSDESEEFQAPLILEWAENFKNWKDLITISFEKSQLLKVLGRYEKLILLDEPDSIAKIVLDIGNIKDNVLPVYGVAERLKKFEDEFPVLQVKNLVDDLKVSVNPIDILKFLDYQDGETCNIILKPGESPYLITEECNYEELGLINAKFLYFCAIYPNDLDKYGLDE